MPSNIRTIHAHEFIQATPEGRLDLERSKKVLGDIASASVGCADCDVILDTREMHSDMTPIDLWELASELHKYRKAFSGRTAFLVPADRFDRAGFFALCAQERGFDVSAFTSVGDATAWLCGTGPQPS